MTAVLVLSHGFLALALVALAPAGEQARGRAARAVGGAGVILGIATVLLRGELDPWRTVSFAPGPAAVAGAAVACAWGIVMSLEVPAERWWLGCVTGAAATALLLLAGGTWLAPFLLFWVCASLGVGVAFARSDRSSWLALGVTDASVVAVLVHAWWVEGSSWGLSRPLHGAAALVLVAAAATRAGLAPYVGAAGVMGRVAIAVVPLWVGGGFVLLLRLVARPLPVAASVALACGIAVVGVTILRRRLDPRLIASWPAALALGICLASEQAAAPAAVAGILAVTAVVLWPDALARGRLSRGFLLSGAIPNVMFAALATAAVSSFAHVGGDVGAPGAAAWVTTTALLPLSLAAGIGLGILVARTPPEGGYHPEAVLATWLLLAASVGAGVILGAGEVYATLGGAPAAALAGTALCVGGVAALRARGAAGVPSPSAEVDVGARLAAPWIAAPVAAALQAAAGGTVAWLVFQGLRVGFL